MSREKCDFLDFLFGPWNPVPSNALCCFFVSRFGSAGENPITHSPLWVSTRHPSASRLVLHFVLHFVLRLNVEGRLSVEGRLNVEGSSVSKKIFGIHNKREEPEEWANELAGGLNLTPLRGNQWGINWSCSGGNSFYPFCPLTKKSRWRSRLNGVLENRNSEEFFLKN